MFKLMKIKDHLYMPPIKKYEKYGHFPWKLIIQFLLIIFTTCQVFFLVGDNTKYTYNQYTIFNRFFLNHDASGGDSGLTNTYMLFSRSSLVSYLEKTVYNYYNINSIALAKYDYMIASSGLRERPRLLVSYIDNKKALDKGYKFEYKLSYNNLGPFSDPNPDDFYNEIQEFYVTFELKDKLEKYQQTSRNCYIWKLKQRYNFSHHGSIIVELSTDNYSCETKDYIIVKHYVWMSIAAMILGSVYLFLTVRDVVNRANLIKGVRTGWGGRMGFWNNLGFKEKMKFFNYWTIFSIAGNVFQILGGVVALLNFNTLMTHQVMIGFGCFFAWVGIIRFIDHRSVSYSIVHTLERSINYISYYVIGVVPIFMGFAFLGICYFWQSGIYPSASMSMLANFALVNGDSVYLFHNYGYQENKFVGQLYYYMFIVFFICCVHNIFIAIVEQNFGAFRVERQNAKSSSSDEEDTPARQSLRQMRMSQQIEKKRQTARAIKTILNAGKQEAVNVYDENTLKVIQKMDNIVDSIIYSLGTLENLSSGSLRFTTDVEELKYHLSYLVEKHIAPILEHFS